MQGLLRDLDNWLDDVLPPSSPGGDYKGMVVGLTLTFLLFIIIYLSSRCFRVDEKTYRETIDKHGLLAKQFLVLNQKKYGKYNDVNGEIFREMRQTKIKQHFEDKDRRRKEKEDTDWLVKEIMERRKNRGR